MNNGEVGRDVNLSFGLGGDYMLPDYDCQVLKLTNVFYDAYPNPPYTEIETKEARRYNCLIVQSHYGYFICVPFRSNVNHKYAFHFRESKRSKKSKSALDYTKTIIIKDSRFISEKQGIVDNDEYTEMMRNIDKIVKEVLNYLEGYVDYYVSKNNKMSKEEFERRYKYSTLKYFHDILGINES